MRLILGVLGLLFFFNSCERPIHKGYKTLGNGIHYRLVTFSGDGNPVQQGDMVRFSMSVYQGDSITWSTPVESLIQADSTAKGLKSLLGFFEVEDSISFRIDKEVVAYDFGSRLDTSLGYGAIRMKLLKVISQEQWLSDMEEVSSLRKGMERALIEAFLDSVSRAVGTGYQEMEGIHWRILKGGEQGPISSGMDVVIGYQCFALSGKLIDVQRTDTEPLLWYHRGMQGALTPGLEKLVLMMPQDAVIEAVIPSDQAYGRRGVPEAGIHPWMPLRFVLELGKGHSPT